MALTWPDPVHTVLHEKDDLWRFAHVAGWAPQSSRESTTMTDRPPLPPFDRDSALRKVQAAEDAWNTRDPERVASAYTVDSVWRNRDTFITGREEIVAF